MSSYIGVGLRVAAGVVSFGGVEYTRYTYYLGQAREYREAPVQTDVVRVEKRNTGTHTAQISFFHRLLLRHRSRKPAQAPRLQIAFNPAFGDDDFDFDRANWDRAMSTHEEVACRTDFHKTHYSPLLRLLIWQHFG